MESESGFLETTSSYKRRRGSYVGQGVVRRGPEPIVRPPLPRENPCASGASTAKHFNGGEPAPQRQRTREWLRTGETLLEKMPLHPAHVHQETSPPVRRMCLKHDPSVVSQPQAKSGTHAQLSEEHRFDLCTKPRRTKDVQISGNSMGSSVPRTEPARIRPSGSECSDDGVHFRRIAHRLKNHKLSRKRVRYLRSLSNRQGFGFVGLMNV